MSTILIIEDDHSIRTAMADLLTGMGYDIITAADGDSGLELALARSYHLLLLDLILPGKSGFEILKALKAQKPGQAVIILSAMGQENDRIKGLQLGADDYCVKPFSVKELLARIDAVLRRSHERHGTNLTIGEYCLDESSSSLSNGQNTIPLGEKEFALLNYLHQNRDRYVSKSEFLQKLWNVRSELTDSRTVEMHVANLRKKLPTGLKIATKRGHGYRIQL